MAVDLEMGKLLVDAKQLQTESMIPGCLTKLFITAAILERNANKPINLDTIVAIQGKIEGEKLTGNVIVKGGGNPFLSSKDLLTGIEKIKALCVKEITGNVIVDKSLFDLKGWKNRFRGAAYGVPAALGLDLHTVSVTAEGATQKAIVDPQNDAVKVRVKSTGRPGIRQMNDYLYEVSGATDASVMHNRFSLTDPSFYAGRLS